ncbi:MAG: NAD(P)/FAD-dependent oxidoreductase [Jatrophihabitans sp.]|uniref:NAD(P)/FAD-dependent oxidoreductase n=1 Tax=Jatrophihabitans sp. TaxID=1932789 RepID=UPI003F7CD89B
MHTAIAAWGVGPAVELYRATVAEIDRTVERLGPDVVRRVGSLRIAGLPDPRGEAEELDREREQADCLAQAAAMLEHGFAVEPHEGGLFFPGDAATNPARRAIVVARPLVDRLVQHTLVTGVAPGRVTTASGTIHCGAVVVAVDGRLDVLLPGVPVRTARLQMLSTAPIAPRYDCPVYRRWGYDYAQQDASGRLFVGGGRDRFAADEWTTDAEPTAPVQGYLDELAFRLAGGPVEVTHRWAASVGFTDDARPLCLLADDGVVAVGGYSGTGNLVGPVTARAAVARVLDGAPAPAWATGEATG